MNTPIIILSFISQAYTYAGMSFLDMNRDYPAALITPELSLWMS